MENFVLFIWFVYNFVVNKVLMTIYFSLSLYLDHFVEFQCFNPDHFVWKCFTRFSYNTAIKTKWMKKITRRMHSRRMRTVRCSGRRGCVSVLGVSAQGVSAQGGVYPSMDWAGRGCLPQCMLGYYHPPCGQNSRHTPVKTLPFRNYYCGR